MKSQMWLLDPRPDHECIVNLIEKSFELSELSNTPVMLEMRVRACHMHGSFACKDNVKPAHTIRSTILSATSATYVTR
jgi:indolepyruvate ferredoxin oxidoreductase alpha subunit